MHGMEVMHAICFFFFVFFGVTYPCALVHWFSQIAEEADDDGGMWMVSPNFDCNGEPNLAVIHIDCIFCTAHLVPIFGDSFIPNDITHHNSLDSFKGFFIDHHVFDIASYVTLWWGVRLDLSGVATTPSFGTLYLKLALQILSEG